jgi:hypothetical protein
MVLTPSTLIRRAQGKITSREEFNSQTLQCLTNAQERVLINRLTECGIPPTSQMVKNFAEEMIGRAVGKNWVGQFCRRHQSELKSLYLRNIDNLRVKGEYGPTYAKRACELWNYGNLGHVESSIPSSGETCPCYSRSRPKATKKSDSCHNVI